MAPVEEGEVLAILVRKPSAIRILRILRERGELYTRRLLSLVGGHWDRSHATLNWLASVGLVERRPDGRRVWNSITRRGEEILELLEGLGLA
ncbi:MAG: hypothetical protein QI223_08150 [Candidatus Korarchaeota archaeon]|nr:hypothetical protein [Candidatus Korarchaeota archaeon]